MRVVFRCDASIQISSGHVMRCLTLADALTANGAQCDFICREHNGHLIEYIRSKGYHVHRLPVSIHKEWGLLCSDWLGATQMEDTQACATVLAEKMPDWLVVAHYALDAYWERAQAEHCGQLMVIDDLANSPMSHIEQDRIIKAIRKALEV
jgi:UDP-2,4-diacetamido-2,4,6-trideoxy-beta-L-altropyranose hydrolase